MVSYTLEARIANPPSTIELTMDGEPGTLLTRSYSSFTQALESTRLTLTATRMDFVESFEIGPGDCYGLLHPSQELSDILVAETFTIYLINSADQIFDRSPDFLCTDLSGTSVARSR